ncbi:MAG: hypothetical protein ACREEH_05405 [Caulobacteraceae bacterium]
MGVFWKEEREFLRQLAIWTRGALDSQQTSALQADRSAKRASASDQLIAERLTAQIATEARKLGL